MKIGIVKELNKEYHEYKPALSKSRLAKMEVCPQYFKWCEDNPLPATEDLIVGSAFHKIVLEPDEFYDEFAVAPICNKRTNAGKEMWAQFEEENYDKQIITQEQFEIIYNMSKAVKCNDYANALLDGEHENSFYAVDDFTQEAIKVRPDCWRKVGDRVVITDLKSCKSAKAEDFMRDVVKFGYDLQAYMYSFVVSKVLNIPIENVDFVFIAVEKKAPYLINLLQADTLILQRGEMLFRKYIGVYHDCKETNEWYGLNGRYGYINHLSLPDYIIKKGE
jgi:exodeoxyribonuclease VIII